jgi:CRISPR-associated protein Cas6
MLEIFTDFQIHSRRRFIMKIDIAFRVSATGTIPVDHGYLLYAALSRRLPYLHESLELGIHSIRGRQVGNRQSKLQDFSRVTLRADVDSLRHLIPLSGSQISLAGTTLLLGVPELKQLEPVGELRSRLVVIKLSHSPKVPEDAFRLSLLRQLEALEVTAPEVVIGQRCTMQIKGREIVGYEVCLNALSPEDSVKIQEHGLGGRHRMGAGLFTAYEPARRQTRPDRVTVQQQGASS